MAKRAPRTADTYRAARRNAARGTVWRSTRRGPIIVVSAAPVRPNKRDRSKEADKARAERAYQTATIDFCNERGLSLMQISYKIKTVFPKKPKRGWAAERRAAPFKDYFDAKTMAAIRARHVHPRHERAA